MATKDLTAPERLTLIQSCLDDGWSWSQIQQTHSVSWKTMDKYFTGSQWTRKQGAVIGAAIRHAQQKRIRL